MALHWVRRETKCEKGRHRQSGNISLYLSQKLMLSKAQKAKKAEDLILLATCTLPQAQQQLDITLMSLSPLGPWGRSWWCVVPPCLSISPVGNDGHGGVGAEVLEYSKAGLLLKTAVLLDAVWKKTVKQKGQNFASIVTMLFSGPSSS